MKVPMDWMEDGHKKLVPKKIATGRVIYIHPRGRHCTVEFALAGGTIRNSYLLERREKRC